MPVPERRGRWPAIREMLRRRSSSDAFHPDAAQTVSRSGPVVIVERRSASGAVARVLLNVSTRGRRVRVHPGPRPELDLARVSDSGRPARVAHAVDAGARRCPWRQMMRSARAEGDRLAQVSARTAIRSAGGAGSDLGPAAHHRGGVGADRLPRLHREVVGRHHHQSGGLERARPADRVERVLQVVGTGGDVDARRRAASRSRSDLAASGHWPRPWRNRLVWGSTTTLMPASATRSAVAAALRAAAGRG